MSITIQFKSFSNLTTGFDYYKKDPTSIKLTQYGEDFIEIELVSGSSIVVGNKVIGSFKVEGQNFEMLFSFTGKVLECTQHEDFSKIMIKWIQFNSEDWKNLLIKFSEAQNVVNDLFERVRG